jgi:hypothetical protein
MYKTILFSLSLFVLIFSDTIELGHSSIKIFKNSVIGTQIDRVFRDLVWENSDYEYGKIKITDSVVSSDLLVPYMEGKLTKILIEYSNVAVKGLTPCVAIEEDNDFFVVNNGKKFLVDYSKTLYKTSVKTMNFGFFEDTHGFNMVLNQALELNKKQNLGLVIACMDLPSKAEAARELAKQGINCYAPCDRFSYLLLGHNTKGTIISSAPIRKTEYGAIIGDQVLKIGTNETIIMQFTNKPYPDQYCDTPTRYFEALKNQYNLDLNLVRVNAGVGETYKVVNEAKVKGASVIAVRLFNDSDIKPVKEWLKSNIKNRAILFHTAAYNIEFFEEFRSQTTFGDLKPLIKRENYD